MSELWFDLLPIAIAMAITPGRLLALILLFGTERALLTPVAFVGGMASNMLVEGLAFALIFSLTGAFDAEDGAGPPAIMAILLVVMGVLLLVAAAKVIIHSEDDDKAPPQWLAEIESFTPGKAYKLGLGWLFVSPKQWIFTLTAVGFIFAANLESVASLAKAGLFKWLKKNAQTILLAVLIVFGLYFLLKGIAALLI
jgi:hypothetical protein